MRSIPRCRLAGALAAVVVGCGVAGGPWHALPAAAQQADPPFKSDDAASFDRYAQRYERIIRRSPRPGTAFDMWYRHYLDAGKLRELHERVQLWLDAEPEDGGIWLIQGLIEQRAGRLPDAAASLAEAESRSKDDPTAPRLLAGILAQQGRLQQAAEALQRALQRNPPPADLLKDLKQLGQWQLRLGQHKQALDTWNRLAERFADDRGVLEELAELLAEEQLWDEAAARWRQAGQLAKDDPAAQLRVRLAIAHVQQQQGQGPAAVALLREALDRIEPDSWQAKDIRDRLQQVFLRANDAAGWLAFWRQRQAERPNDLSCRLELARVLAAMDRQDESLRQLREAIAVAPSRHDVRLTLIQQLRASGQWREAIEQARQWVQRAPSDIEGWDLLARLHLEQLPVEDRSRAVQQAIRCWQSMVDARPQDPALALRGAETCRRLAATLARPVVPDTTDSKADTKVSNPGKSAPNSAATESVPAGTNAPLSEPPSERAVGGETAERLLLAAAERFYRAAYERATGQAPYDEYLGEFLHSQGRSREAIAVWKKHIDQLADAADADAWQRHSELLARHGYLAEATFAAEQALRLAPDRFPAVVHQVQLLLKAGQSGAAIERLPALLDAAQNETQRRRALEVHVEIFQAAGLVEQQIHDLQQLLREDRGSVLQYRLLALLLTQRWRWKEASEAWEAALRGDDEDPVLMRQFAETLERQGLLAAAAGQYQQLLERDPRNRAADGRAMVKLEIRRNDLNAARRWAEQLVRWSPASFESLEVLADVAFRQDDEAAALGALRKMVRLAPDDLNRRKQLADVLAARGHLAEAREHYWHCFERADSFEEKRAIVFALAERAQEPLDLEAIVDQLRSVRFRGDDPTLSRLCAVALLRRAQHYEAAEVILRDMLAQRPNDLEVLGELADMARERQQFTEALALQQRLVQLDDRPSQLEMLAADFGRAGQREKAVEVWQRILRQSNDEEAIVRAVDQQFGAGALVEALELADWGCAKRPDSWALLFRSAHANVALGRLEDADARFQAILRLPVSTAERIALIAEQRVPLPPLTSRLVSVPLETTAMQWSEPASAELRELQQAAVAHARWTTLLPSSDPPSPAATATSPAGKVNRAAGTGLPSLPATRQGTPRRQLLASVAMPTMLITARIESLVARSRIAERQRRSTAWQQQLIDQSEQHVEPLRHLMLTRALDGQPFFFGWDELQPLIDRQPDDALPHLLRVSSIVGTAPEAWQGVAGRRLRIASDLLASFRWLKRRWPALARQCRDHVGQQMIVLGDPTSARELVVSELRECVTLEDIADLAGLAALLDDATLRGQVLTAALAAELEADETTRASNLEWLLLLALTGHDENALDADQLDAVLALFDRRMRTATLGSSPAALPNHVKRSQQLRQIVARRQPARLQDAGVVGRTPAARSQRVSTAESLLSLWGVNSANSLTPGGVGSRAFPAATRRFDARLGHLLWRIYGVVSEPMRAEQSRKFEQLIKQGQQSPNQELAARYRMAEVCLLWWRAEQTAAVGRMLELCESFPDDPELRLLVANAYSIQKDFRRCLAQLDLIKSPPPDVAAAAGELRGQIQDRWSGEALLHVLTGHSGVVRSIAFAPDGKRLASGSVDRTVGLWDAESGLRTRTIETSQDIVLCVVFSPDGRLVAFTGYDRMIRLWDVAQEKEVGVIAAGDTAVRCLAFSPDGKTLASASDDGTLQLWDVAERNRMATLAGHRGTVLALAFSHDGTRLASGGAEAEVMVWNVAEGKVLHRLQGHQDRVSAVIFSPDDTTLYTASWDGAVVAWDANAGQQRTAHEQSSKDIRGMAVSPDGKLLAWGGEDRILRVVRLSDWHELTQLRGHSGAVQTVVFSPDSRLVASAGYDGNVHVWQVRDGGEKPVQP